MGGTPDNSGASAIKGNSVEEPLKHLMQELGNAINDSLSESDRIAEAIGEIKRAGYDVFLVLEATIGFNRRDENSEEEDGEEIEATEEQPKRNFEATGKIKFTSQDHRFLRALKIAVDEENR
jgi:ABC-type branched-subunit amino acid transport system substrate-binding protein